MHANYTVVLRNFFCLFTASWFKISSVFLCFFVVDWSTQRAFSAQISLFSMSGVRSLAISLANFLNSRCNLSESVSLPTPARAHHKISSRAKFNPNKIQTIPIGRYQHVVSMVGRWCWPARLATVQCWQAAGLVATHTVILLRPGLTQIQLKTSTQEAAHMTNLRYDWKGNSDKFFTYLVSFWY